MKVTKWETLCHEDHGATLKHKCGKRMLIAPSLFFSHFSVFFSFFVFLAFSFFLHLFYFFLFWWASLASFFIWASLASFIYFRQESHPDLWGNHSLHHPFLTRENALIMKIIIVLFTYNSQITTRYLEQNMTLYECLRRCTGICNESRVTCMKELWRWPCHKYDVN